MKNFFSKKQKGQGIVEYAGALALAGLIVAAVIAVGVPGVSGMWNTVLATVTNQVT